MNFPFDVEPELSPKNWLAGRLRASLGVLESIAIADARKLLEPDMCSTAELDRALRSLGFRKIVKGRAAIYARVQLEMF